MAWEAWFTLAVVLTVFVSMVRDWGPPDVVLLAGAIAVALAGIITPEEAFSGFANEGVLTVGALFIVVMGLRETGALDTLGGRMLGKAKTERAALLGMATRVTFLSAFLNNTPIVAMMIPVVTDWCRKHRVSPSRLLIPLSQFTVLGGVCTLIGTSTNLVVNGLVLQARASQNGPRLDPFWLFEITPLGLICAALGTAYILLVGRRLLPDRKDLIEQLGESAREYLVDVVIQPGCRLAGQSVAEAGLRHLPGLFLVAITRNGQYIAPVAPDETLRTEDRLTFTGVVSSIVDLERTPGLVPAADDAYETRVVHRRQQRLCEAVISPVSPLIGKTIRDADFRALYNAAVVAVHRGGARLTGRIGDIVLHVGDTLLLQTGVHFARAHRNNPDFMLVSSLDEARPVRHDRAPLALALLVLLVGLMVSGVVSVVMAAFLVAVLMIATRCISASDALAVVDWQTLVSIAADFGLGKALAKSGAAEMVAGLVVHATGSLGPIAALAAIYLVTMVFTEAITNNAAAALMFPLAIAAAGHLHVSPRPFVVGIMFAASLAFATPIGYQTNMMVYGPGGYRFLDFTRVGLPLNLILWVAAVLFIPMLWPF
ncbi:MAG: SLC13 family permease [Armatimonadetes bacterium]|nr:SLC13 family permease [Armatimonadota bacterium]